MVTAVGLVNVHVGFVVGNKRVVRIVLPMTTARVTGVRKSDGLSDVVGSMKF